MPGAEPLHFSNSYPQLFDATETTAYDPHYFYQAVWAMAGIAQGKSKAHVDVGSDVRFVGMLTTHLPVIFVDIRPLNTDLLPLTCVSGSILSLPFNEGSVESLSCLHVVEHVGLGRYGDPLNPFGTRQACAELARVLAPSGNLYFSTPVGHPRVCFNAHRIHSSQQILDYFPGLELVEFSGVDDRGRFCRKIDLDDLADAYYACGLFRFTKKV
jgi:hypothetical protein